MVNSWLDGARWLTLLVPCGMLAITAPQRMPVSQPMSTVSGGPNATNTAVSGHVGNIPSVRTRNV